MAEGTSLLRMHTAYTCIVGSNPTVSASIFKNPLRRVFSFLRFSFEKLLIFAFNDDCL